MSAAAVVTITPNPALDLATGVPRLESGPKLRCEAGVLDPGGGGINAARVVHELGGRATALHTSGGLTGRRLGELLDECGVDNVAVPISQETRESFTVHERDSGRLYRFVLPGPRVSPPEWERLMKELRARIGGGAVVLLSGSMPPGVPAQRVGALAAEVASAGSRLLVDVAGPAMRAALEAGVFMARFNRPEFEEFVGRRLDDIEERMGEARALVATGAAQAVVATAGADGALIASADRAVHVRPPRVEADSPVGAGDSMMGAICLALAHRWDLVDAGVLGVAAAAAAHMTPGTELCRRPDVIDVFAQIAGHPPPAPVGPTVSQL